jgi:glycosyltransferase involved in cell wall biosynthesis
MRIDMPSKDFLVIIPPIPFADYTRRFHYEALAGEGCNVTIFPFPASLHRLFVGEFCPDNRFLDNTQNVLSAQLQILPQSFGLPRILYGHFIIFRWIQLLLLKHLLRNFLRKETVVILTNCDMWPFWGLISGNHVVFDLTDAPWHLSHLGSAEKIKKFSEHCGVLFKSDQIFCSSVNLTKFARHFNTNVHYLPNTTRARENCEFKTPGESLVFGFIGNINDWIDLSLVEKLGEFIKARNHKLMFVGEINGTAAFHKEFRELIARGIVVYKDKVKMDAVSDVILSFDVCLLPYKLDKFNSYVFPNKIVQYLFCGKPIITTNFCPDLFLFKSCIHIAYSQSAFIDLAGGFISGSLKISVEQFQEIRSVAKKHSANERAKLRLNKICGYLNGDR